MTLGLWFWFHFPVLLGDQAWSFLDASNFFFPIWKWGWETWHQGVVPLWNPLFGAGRPHAADPQTAAFYPFLVLGAWAGWDFWNTVHWFLALHHVLGMIGVWVWLKSEGRSAPAAFCGAWAFGFCIHAAALFWVPVLLWVTAWSPWMFWSLGRMIRGKPFGCSAFLVFSALQLAGGYPLLSYLLFWVLSVEGAVGFPKGRKKEGVLWIVFLSAAAGALNAGWILPFFEFLKHTDFAFRPERVSLGWRDLQSFGFPFSAPHPILQGTAEVIGWIDKLLWTNTYYLGWPIGGALLFFLAAGVFLSTDRDKIWLWAGLTLLTLGENGGLFPMLREVIPGFSAILRSGFWMPLWILYSIRLAAAGIDLGLNFRPRLFFLSCGLCFLWPWMFPGFFEYWPKSETVWLASAGCMLLAWLLWKKKEKALFPAVFFFSFSVILSLFPAALSLRASTPEVWYRRPPKWAKGLQAGDRIYHTPPAVERLRVLKGERWSEAFASATNILAPNLPIAFRWGCWWERNTLKLPKWMEWKQWSPAVSFAHSRMALDYSGAKVVIGKTTLGLRKIAEASEVIYENPNRFPKWFSVLRVEAHQKTNEWNLKDELRRIERAGGYRQLALTYGESRGLFPLKPVVVEEKNPNHVRLVLPGGGPAFLVSSQLAFPAWKVQKPQGKARLQVVNYTFLGLEVEDGVLEVDLVYRPVTFRLGGFLSFLALAGMVFGGVCRTCLQSSRKATFQRDFPPGGKT